MDNPEQKARQHQAHGNFGIDARAAIVGTIEAGPVIAKPPKVENPIYLYQNMVVGDQTTHRSGDEKLQVSAFLPTRHRSLPSTDKQSESEASGFSNSPRGTVFPTNGILKKASAYFTAAALDRPFRK